MDDLRIAVGGDAGDLGLEFRRDLHARERARDEVPDLLGLAVDDDPGLLEQLRQFLVAGLAVGALGDVLLGVASAARRRWPSAAAGARGRRLRDQPRHRPGRARREGRDRRRAWRRRPAPTSRGRSSSIEDSRASDRLLELQLQRLQLDVMLGVELLDVEAGEHLQACASCAGAPRTRWTMSRRHLDPDQPLRSSSVDQTNGVLPGPLGGAEINAFVDRNAGCVRRGARGTAC